MLCPKGSATVLSTIGEADEDRLGPSETISSHLPDFEENLTLLGKIPLGRAIALCLGRKRESHPSSSSRSSRHNINIKRKHSWMFQHISPRQLKTVGCKQISSSDTLDCFASSVESLIKPLWRDGSSPPRLVLRSRSRTIASKVRFLFTFEHHSNRPRFLYHATSFAIMCHNASRFRVDVLSMPEYVYRLGVSLVVSIYSILILEGSCRS